LLLNTNFDCARYENKKAQAKPKMLDKKMESLTKYITKKAAIICIPVEMKPTVAYLTNFAFK
jgi:hypothetical protein